MGRDEIRVGLSDLAGRFAKNFNGAYNGVKRLRILCEGIGGDEGLRVGEGAVNRFAHVIQIKWRPAGVHLQRRGLGQHAVAEGDGQSVRRQYRHREAEQVFGLVLKLGEGE